MRRVILAPEMNAMLRKRKEDAFAAGRARPEDLVFPSRRGTPLGHRNVARAFTTIVDRAGLGGEKRLTFHGLRHVYASMVIERGITPTVLAEQMGTRARVSPSSATSTCSTASEPTRRCARRCRRRWGLRQQCRLRIPSA